MRKIDLSLLLDEVTNLGECLGPAEYKILEDARIILQGQFPTDEANKAAYLSRSTQTQSDLINLQSRLSYIHTMKSHEKDAYRGQLIKKQEYSAKDFHYLALYGSSVYRDLCETVETLDTVNKTINELLWSLKMAVRKV